MLAADVAKERSVIVTVSTDCTARLWNYETLKCEVVHSFRSEEPVSVAIHSSGIIPYNIIRCEWSSAVWWDWCYMMYFGTVKKSMLCYGLGWGWVWFNMLCYAMLCYAMQCNGFNMMRHDAMWCLKMWCDVIWHDIEWSEKLKSDDRPTLSVWQKWIECEIAVDRYANLVSLRTKVIYVFFLSSYSH